VANTPTGSPPLDLGFYDYHRTVIAFHGTTAETADRLVRGDEFEASDNDDDWFGTGVYFWEHAPKQAWWWARKFKNYDQPAVVGAIIRLGNCFDLLDPGNVLVLQQCKAKMEAAWPVGVGKPIIMVISTRNLTVPFLTICTRKPMI